VLLEQARVRGGTPQAADTVAGFSEALLYCRRMRVSAVATRRSGTARMSVLWRVTIPGGSIRIGCGGAGSPSIIRARSCAAR
jgi:hypothetical protein